MRKTGKHTLVIDGNYFIFRTLHVLPKPKSKMLLESKEDSNFFMKKLAIDLSYQLRQFEGIIDSVVWTIDSKSWRKDFYPEAEYKGNRKQDSTIDWNNFSKITGDFISILEKHGVIISKIDGAEGDDLMYAWNAECVSNNKSVIIFSGDKDIIQLIGKNSDDTHTILYSPVNKKLYTYEGFLEWLNESEKIEESNSDDFFEILKLSKPSPEANSKKILSDLIKKKDIVVNEINPDDFRFKKILTGDAGDNVPSAYWYEKSNRIYKISENKAQLILNEFKEKHGNVSLLYLFNDEYLRDLTNIIVKVMKAKYMTKETIFSNLKMNISLMILSSHTIPESITDEMFKSIEPNLKKQSLKIKNVVNYEKLLDNTEYKINKDSIKINSSVFSNDSDESDDFSFITDRKTNKKLF